jgi:hypothetical protein
MLKVTFDRVADNRGANTPGVDGLQVSDVEEASGVPGFLDGLRAQLTRSRPGRPELFQAGPRGDADRLSQFSSGLPRMCLLMSHDRRIKFIYVRHWSLLPNIVRDERYATGRLATVWY